MDMIAGPTLGDLFTKYAKFDAGRNEFYRLSF
jgi:hypothetical protein